MRLPLQSAHTRGDGFHGTSAFRDERRPAVMPQQDGAFVIEHRPGRSYAPPVLEDWRMCRGDCICHIGGHQSSALDTCPCCFVVVWW